MMIGSEAIITLSPIVVCASCAKTIEAINSKDRTGTALLSKLCMEYSKSIALNSGLKTKVLLLESSLQSLEH